MHPTPLDRRITDMTEDKTLYILRYYLPMEPYVTPDITKQRFRELMDFCHECDVKAVMFYVAFRSDWYYMPDSTEHASIWAENMTPFIREMRKNGISYQLNFQNLIGAITGGADFTKDYGWEMMRDHKGITSKGCACFLGPRFREDMGNQIQIWAATEPDVIWLDDDFRLHNHGSLQHGGYLDWYCYCDEHIKRFNERHGTSYDRVSLLSAMLASGKPDSVRALWLDFQGEMMAETAAWVYSKVRSVSPHTRIAQMTSLPGVHAAEGRNWGSFLNALTGGEDKALLRPHFGPYSENSPVDFLNSFTVAEQTRSHISQQYGIAEYCPEVENTRFTAWSKSVAATRFQLYLSLLIGCRGITLSLFDLEGSPLDEEPDFIRLLKEEKPRLDALAKLHLDTWNPIGVALVTSCKTARQIELEEAAESPDALSCQNRTFDEILIQCGIPARYVSTDEALDSDDLVVIDGDTVCAFSDEQLEELMKRNVLLDGEAARRIVSRGFADDIGITETSKGQCMTSAELFSGIHEGKRMPCRLAESRWIHFSCKKGAEILSTLILCTGQRVPGLVGFHNRKGGRIFSYPAFGLTERGFFNHVRASSLRLLVRYASPAVPLFFCNRPAITIARKSGSNLLVASAPLSPDGACSFTAELPVNMKCTGAKVFTASDFLPLDESHMHIHDNSVDISISRGLYEWLIIILKLEPVSLYGTTEKQT